MPNKIWIELDNPKANKDLKTAEQAKAFADEQCRLANNMLKRLRDDESNPSEQVFYWSESDRCYCWGGPMGYETLPDHGKWFNLDYLGRQL